MARATTPAPIAPQRGAQAPYGLPVMGLDMSSTCIGHALHDGAAITAYGHTDLDGDIAARCEAARAHVAALLDAHRPALVVIESPVARFAKAVLPQARVSGAVLAEFSRRGTLWHEVPPSVPKALLAGSGAAGKREMVTAAAALLGLDGDTTTIKGKVWWLDVAPLLSEDEADAVGLALAGLAVRVRRAA